MNEEKIKENVAKAAEHRKQKLDKITLETLAKMLSQDIWFFSTHYIKNRVLELFEKTNDKLDYKNKVIEDARIAFFDVLIAGMKENIYSWDDELLELRKQLKTKDPDKRAKASQRIKVLERLKAGTPKDKSEERDYLCEPICRQIMLSLLDEKNFENKDFIKNSIKLDNELLIADNLIGDIEELFNQIYNSLDHSYKMANEKKWGCSREFIRMSELDSALKE